MVELIRTTDGTGTLYTVAADGAVMGYVAIDSAFRGRSCGGLRMLPCLDAEDMLALAHAMTLKYALLGLPQGGAKAGVCGNGDWPARRRLERLVEFARAIAPLLSPTRQSRYGDGAGSGQFVPCTDMGTSADDIRHMLRAVGLPVGRNELRNNLSGFYTAISVAASAVAAVRHLGLALAGRTAAIEGFGNVGRPLAEALTALGVRVVAISTSRGAIHNPDGLDIHRLAELSQHAGSGVIELFLRKDSQKDSPAERMDPLALLELPVDLLCPCAIGGSVFLQENVGNAPRVAARIIAPGANNAMSQAAEAALLERGVVCVPDFVANCGGVLGGTMEFAAIPRARIVDAIRGYMTAAVEALLAKARREAVAPRLLAEQVALRRRQVMLAEAERPGLAEMATGFAAALHRRGLLPRFLVGAAAPVYFERTLAAMVEELQ